MIFRRALIRLTLTYTLVQLILFGVFALGIYSFVTGAFDFDAAELDGQSSLNVAEQGFDNLRMGLTTGYAILVILLPISSYLMARGALAPIRRSYELQQRFVDGASHEFRSPLSVIQGELELALSRSRTPAQYQAAMSTALEAAEGLTRLTNDLLLLTRESAEELEVTFQPVSLNEIAHSVVQNHKASGARITASDTRTVLVNGSAELLTRALTNLVDNAVKFTNESGSIQIVVSAAGKFAQILVRDNGVGMTPTESAHAFDRFWRAQDARNTPGFGLGLPLVKQIISAHHGKVTLVSEPRSGTTVTLTVPEWQP
ncbi:HAMP domain-containing histidine kinase [Cryobacterium adonitolivorans]|uniref:histidine kinase n=1 Tax=Cryobacterium adonitolivorans TaxID=1259189 RepID=A0A4R8W200_9MICO|nr:HAMP domain-containing sensor histidine kinase [Cryobacterium adonitolivorans]TFC00990.1 HAMP domain-containing histidine kinase [Cryobacterium adonitolivorans]